MSTNVLFDAPGPRTVVRHRIYAVVTLVRNTPLVIVFAFFAFVAPKFDITFGWLDIHIGQFDFTSFFGAAVVSFFASRLERHWRVA